MANDQSLTLVLWILMNLSAVMASVMAVASLSFGRSSHHSEWRPSMDWGCAFFASFYACCLIAAWVKTSVTSDASPSGLILGLQLWVAVILLLDGLVLILCWL